MSNGEDKGIGTCCHLGANYFAMTGLDFYGYQRDPNSPSFASSTLTNCPEAFQLCCSLSVGCSSKGTLSISWGAISRGYREDRRQPMSPSDVTFSKITTRSMVMLKDSFTFETKDLVVEDNVFDHNGWNATLIIPAAVTVSIASPAVVTWSGNDLRNNAAIEFSSTGSLPTGLASSTIYCVMNYATTTFNVYNDGGNCAGGGTAINTSGSQSGTQLGIWEDPAPVIFQPKCVSFARRRQHGL